MTFPNISAVELERLAFSLRTMISQEMLGTDVRYVEDMLTDSIVFQVHGFVWAEAKSAKVFTHEYPADWRQAFKARWFPAWAKHRWPVRMAKIKVDVKAIYPDYRPALPDKQYRLTIWKSDFDPGVEFRG